MRSLRIRLRTVPRVRTLVVDPWNKLLVWTRTGLGGVVGRFLALSSAARRAAPARMGTHVGVVMRKIRTCAESRARTVRRLHLKGVTGTTSSFLAHAFTRLVSVRTRLLLRLRAAASGAAELARSAPNTMLCASSVSALMVFWAASRFYGHAVFGILSAMTEASILLALGSLSTTTMTLPGKAGRRADISLLSRFCTVFVLAATISGPVVLMFLHASFSGLPAGMMYSSHVWIAVPVVGGVSLFLTLCMSSPFLVAAMVFLRGDDARGRKMVSDRELHLLAALSWVFYGGIALIVSGTV